MAEEEAPELMTVKETAEYLRIPLPTVYYLVQRGQLPAIQIGGRWRIKRSLLDSQVRLLGAELRLARAKADKRIAFAALETAAGEKLR